MICAGDGETKMNIQTEVGVSYLSYCYLKILTQDPQVPAITIKDRH
jgi:hypothetical protein